VADFVAVGVELLAAAVEVVAEEDLAEDSDRETMGSDSWLSDGERLLVVGRTLIFCIRFLSPSVSTCCAAS
jgi:hypothetical protein